MIALDSRQAVIVSVSEQPTGEDRVVITLTPDNCVLALTAQQARALSTQIIQAVQRVEVKTSLAQPRQAMHRTQNHPTKNPGNTLLVK
ncbi:hypothetical protein TPL01_22600 [Sulfuriferula plumbiphila]|uniref:Uncharacterized protein n=1 Tax=Sulfuriferula plumbiphila TaxID=171865 RepID=A0A512L9J5_9PROT|nr:hypothetical protein [Sulfuriferula plumbiphila]BBP05969.1 hypothetical protein SFPGR_33910 [Sulfuriferula plumbiphila]GEP31122.1 hypothetical protein TPL01_22600 [Sulfuriferula plumbiphila]